MLKRFNMRNPLLIPPVSKVEIIDCEYPIAHHQGFIGTSCEWGYVKKRYIKEQLTNNPSVGRIDCYNILISNQFLEVPQ